MVPYRDSKLTLLFKNYFEGFGKIKMILCINPSLVEFDETINVLKFSDLVRDVLVPSAASTVLPPPLAAVSSLSSSQECVIDPDLSILKRLHENNYTFAKGPLPSLDIFTPDDDQTINNLISYLEECAKNRNLIIKEMEQLKQTFLSYLKSSDEAVERAKEERDEFKAKLELREKDQLKSETKIKALEKIINTNSFSTPIVSKSTTEQAWVHTLFCIF